MTKKQIVLVSLGNGYSNGLGGGLVRTIALATYLDNFTTIPITLVISPGIAVYFRDLKRITIFVQRFPILERLQGILSEKASLLFYYIAILFRTPRVNIKNTLVYSQTEYPWDVMSSLRLIKNRDANSLAVIFHHVVGRGNRISLNNVFSRLCQLLSSFLLQRYKKDFKLVIYDTVSGSEVVEYLARFRLTFTPLRVLNGFSSAELRRAKLTSTESLRAYDAVFVGGLRQQKGLEQFGEFLSAMLKIDAKLKVAVIGNIEPKVLSMFQHLPNVKFLGGLNHHECLAYMASCKVLFSPSTAEGFGIAILEGILLGKLVVTYPLPVMIDTFKSDIRVAADYSGLALAKAVVGAIHDSNTYRPHQSLGERYMSFEWDNIFHKEIETLLK